MQPKELSKGVLNNMGEEIGCDEKDEDIIEKMATPKCTKL